MSRPASRLWVLSGLLALLCLALLVGCSSTPQDNGQKPGATKTPHKTPIVQASGTPAPAGTPSATATPLTACGGQLSDVVIPNGSTLVGPVSTSGATVGCAYLVHNDLQTVETFFKTQMGSKGWTFLNQSSEGPQAVVQTYFKGQSFATITLSQHNQDTHSTDFTISVESSK
jgi:hypothetical protein